MQKYIQIDYVDENKNKKLVIVTCNKEEALNYLFILNVASKKILERKAFIASIVTYNEDDYRGEQPTIIEDNLNQEQLKKIDIPITSKGGFAMFW